MLACQNAFNLFNKMKMTKVLFPFFVMLEGINRKKKTTKVVFGPQICLIWHDFASARGLKWTNADNTYVLGNGIT